ncbi:putative tricarboxylic transport membrane protein [Paracoccus halophilus]|uniref:Putative tricarboxylic transport membrane protein n=1 Tax=Paracoccus halophilus TaxID=376733 RepID=A0A099EYM1_9RHOB|nr:tripartite tricarboxylate transporter TctB family protein [Paracoccus halophilus]KGJ03076.1 hypothetical protein IT41_15285 [Paracoccus halophilus]SFA53158.1 putative tricarboxylic transport membrane protein [Paracoccus halophilus]
MLGSVDRLSGAFLLVFGLALYFYIVPNFAEQMDEVSLSPDALPKLYSLGIALGGLLMVLRPAEQEAPEPRLLLRVALFVAILFAALYAISWIGFVVVAPLLALTLMLMVGEHRPLWLAIGVVVIPALIWLLVTQLLGRALP